MTWEIIIQEASLPSKMGAWITSLCVLSLQRSRFTNNYSEFGRWLGAPQLCLLVGRFQVSFLQTGQQCPGTLISGMMGKCRLGPLVILEIIMGRVTRVLIKALPPSNEKAAVDESCIVAAYHLKLEQGSEIMQRKAAKLAMIFNDFKRISTWYLCSKPWIFFKTMILKHSNITTL